MKSELIRLLMFASKQAFYIFLVQLIGLQLLVAEPLSSQSLLRDTEISLLVENATMQEVFEAIEGKTTYTFAFGNAVIKDKQTFDLNVREDLHTLLYSLAAESRYNFRRINDMIYVIPRKKNEQQQIEEEFADRTLTGKVTDREGEPLTGATVRIKGTSIGTITDIDGNFRLIVPNEATTLAVTFIGFLSAEIEIADQISFQIALEEDLQALGEVVVVGYGTQKQANVSSALGSLDPGDIQEQPILSFDRAMSGKLPGVRVLQNSGMPGAGVQIRIRGTNSINAGNEPLYVIDGVPLAKTVNYTTGPSIDLQRPTGSSSRYEQPFNPLNTLNLNDIESVEVLKDAAAAAIYGSRGSNGVVLITTKKGKGKPTVTYNTNFGVQRLLNKIDVLDAYEFAEFAAEARNTTYLREIDGALITDTYEERIAKGANNNHLILPELQPYLNGEPGLTNTDWQDEVFREAIIHDHSISFGGSSENLEYFFSGNYFSQEGILLGTGLERYNTRLNLGLSVNDRVKVGVNLNPTYIEQELANAEGPWFDQGLIGTAIGALPIYPVRNNDGTYFDVGQNFAWSSDFFNVVEAAEKHQDELEHSRLLGNVFGTFEVLDRLTYRLSLGFDLNDYRRSYFRNSSVPLLIGSDPKALSSTESSVNWLIEHTLTYDWERGGHNLTALGGFTSQQESINSNSIAAENFANNLVPTLNAGQIVGGGSFVSEWSLMSWLGRVLYDYEGKYLLSMSVRTDGSSRFGRGNRWGTFPSLSAGWRISDESFFALDFISNLKFRSSYGITGNFEIPNYGSIGLLSQENYVLGNGNIVSGLVPSTPSNEDLTWEKTTTLDFGIDLGFWEDRIYVEGDYFVSNTTDLLLNVPIPSASGFTTALQNIGEVENVGWEALIGVRNRINNFRFDINANITAIANEVKSLGVNDEPIVAVGNPSSATWITEVGGEIGAYYLPVADGIFNSEEEISNTASVADAEPGDIRFRDVNGDGVINLSEDRAVVGSIFPDFYYGLNTYMAYKQFDFSFSLQGVQGFEILNMSRRYYGAPESFLNPMRVVAENVWRSAQEPGDGQTPRANRIQTGASEQVSTYHVEDGSYVRINNLTCGYTLPESVYEALPITKARFYLRVQNPFLFTDYSGYNPEVNNRPDNALAPGEDYGNYPLSTIYSLGASISFK